MCVRRPARCPAAVRPAARRSRRWWRLRGRARTRAAPAAPARRRGPPNRGSRGGRLERADRVLLFAADPERRAAGDDDACPGRAAEDRRDVGRRPHQVLEVVQDQQRGAIGQVREEGIGSGSLRPIEEAHGRGRSPTGRAPAPRSRRARRTTCRRARLSSVDRASSMASRVLPMPPGPVSVSRRCSSRSSSSSTELATPPDEARQRQRDVARRRSRPCAGAGTPNAGRGRPAGTAARVGGRP